MAVHAVQGLNTLVRALDEELCVHQSSDFVCVSVYGPRDSPSMEIMGQEETDCSK